VDPESDMAIATLAQILLQEGRAPEALEFFDRAVELARTEQELVSALSYAEVPPPVYSTDEQATRAQLDVTTKYPHLAEKLSKMTAEAQQGMPV
jgi:mitochondrial import receptor subunit TOM70